MVVRAAAQSRRAGRPDVAETLLRMWLHHHPFHGGALYELSLSLIAQGRFSEGWAPFESRLGLRPTPSLPFPRWRGESVRDRAVLVVGELLREEQSLFLPFVDALPERGSIATFVCAPDLASQLAGRPYRVLPMGGEVEFDEPDLWIMQGSIPGIVGGGSPEIAAWAMTA